MQRCHSNNDSKLDNILVLLNMLIALQQIYRQINLLLVWEIIQFGIRYIIPTSELSNKIVSGWGK